MMDDRGGWLDDGITTQPSNDRGGYISRPIHNLQSHFSDFLPQSGLQAGQRRCGPHMLADTLFVENRPVGAGQL
jgi:hypothetical protein